MVIKIISDQHGFNKEDNITTTPHFLLHSIPNYLGYLGTTFERLSNQARNVRDHLTSKNTCTLSYRLWRRMLPNKALPMAPAAAPLPASRV
jgi:hypothetical protein